MMPHQRMRDPGYLAGNLQRGHTHAMQADASTFIDGFRFGFFMGIGVSLLMGGLLWGYLLAMRPDSASSQGVKSRAASASS
jgi:hypothetical protein